MFWSFKREGKEYVSWGQPRNVDNFYDYMPRFDALVHYKEKIYPNDRCVSIMQGDGSFGVGDSIWLIQYYRLIYKHLLHTDSSFTFVSSKKYIELFGYFLPKQFKFYEEYMLWDEFIEYDHLFPTLYYWKNLADGSDKSWTDNQSILQRMCTWSGIPYDGLEDWRDFSPQSVLYPNSQYFDYFGIDRDRPYILIQWHSSGQPKNIAPKVIFDIIDHLQKRFKNHQIVIIGTYDSLKLIRKKDVIVTVGKTSILDLFSLAANAKLIVCPDSAAMHLAEAYKVPCVCIMSVLPPIAVASKYRIPAFMFGRGYCPYAPCGFVHHLPKETHCPKEVKNYCALMSSINFHLFDECIDKTIINAANWNNSEYKPESVNFYDGINRPISLMLQ